VTVHQDVNLYAGTLDAGAEAKVSIALGRHAWIQWCG